MESAGRLSAPARIRVLRKTVTFRKHPKGCHGKMLAIEFYSNRIGELFIYGHSLKAMNSRTCHRLHQPFSPGESVQFGMKSKDGAVFWNSL